MEKRNTLLLTVIAVATLLVAVVGATFAYFASTSSVTNTLDLNTTTQASTASLTAEQAALAMTVTPDLMQKGDAKNEVAKFATEDLKVTLSSTMPATCTYNISWAWDSGVTYTPVASLDSLGGKEFTIAIAYADNKATGDEVTNSGTPGQNITLGTTETNFDKVPATVITGAKIYTDGTAATIQTWTVTARVYNLNADQANLLGAEEKGTSFTGKFSITDVVC